MGVKVLRVLGMLEACSFLLLLFVAMPMKYWLDNGSLIAPVGMAHGVLFLAYLLVLLVVSHQQKWPVSMFVMGLLAAILPFGPLVFDAKVAKLARAEAVQ